MSSATTLLYRFGWLIWFWRVVIAFAIGASALVVWFAIREGSLTLALVVIPLLAPAVFFGVVLAASVELAADGSVVVRTLLFGRRRIAPGRIGAVKVRTKAETDAGPVHAPRMWVAVKGGLPIYLDLLAEIPDRPALDRAFRGSRRRG